MSPDELARLPFYRFHSKKQVKFPLLPPTGFEVVGSAATGTLTKPHLTIDIVMFMPAVCFACRLPCVYHIRFLLAVG